MSRSAVFAGVLAVFLGSASGQQSCVQVANPFFARTCPCYAGSDFTFTMEGQTTVEANTVNVAVIIDSSGSVTYSDWVRSKEFAKNTVASFASLNLFTNGGSASYAQFSSTTSPGGTFYSLEAFNNFVDTEPRLNEQTNIIAGIAKGRQLLGAASSSAASFMIVTTDGNANLPSSPNPQAEADAARAEGTILYAVGVGSVPSQATLLAIGGHQDNVFDVDNFQELDSALQDIISTSAGSIPCAATNATVTIEFNSLVVDATVEGGVASYTGTQAIFTVDDLEAIPTNFSVVLDTCSGTDGSDIIVSVSYADDEGNMPDLSFFNGTGVVPTCDVTTPPTPAPTNATVETPPPVPVDDSSDDFSYDLSFWYDDDDSGEDVTTPPTPAPTFATMETPPPVPVDDSSDDFSYDLSFWYDDDDSGEDVTTPPTPAPTFATMETPPPAPHVPGPAPHYVGTPPPAEPSPGSSPTTSGHAPLYTTTPTPGTPGSTTPGHAPMYVTSPTPGTPGSTTPGHAPMYMTSPTPGTPGATPEYTTTPTPWTTGTHAAVYTTTPTPGTVCVCTASPDPAPTTTHGTAPTTPGFSHPAEPSPGAAPTTTPAAAPGSAHAPPAPGSGMTTCSNGVYGIESDNGQACCENRCGSCGGEGCSRRPGGAYGCCVTEILDEGEACAATGAAPCYIDGEFVLDPVVPSMSPTMPTQEPVTPPTQGIPSMPSLVAPVSPSPVSPTPVSPPITPHGEGSYSYYFSFDFRWWADDEYTDLSTWCSNGIPGVESERGEVCCPAGCGACGGIGCSTRAAPAYGSSDCCIFEIMDYGQACSVTGEAPCYLDG